MNITNRSFSVLIFETHYFISLFIVSGRDLIGIAKTGSGKTVAFVLPLLRHIMDQAPLEETDGPMGKG